MKGELEASAAWPVAGRVAEKTQSQSHAHRSVQRFFGIFEYPKLFRPNVKMF
jgi:hypothetical protein